MARGKQGIFSVNLFPATILEAARVAKYMVEGDVMQAGVLRAQITATSIMKTEGLQNAAEQTPSGEILKNVSAGDCFLNKYSFFQVGVWLHLIIRKNAKYGEQQLTS